ncbi:MAG: hypothetical protein ACYCW6_02755 [Candidatus Xenobia bacterium]
MKRLLFSGILLGLLTLSPAFAGSGASSSPNADVRYGSGYNTSQPPAYDRLNDIDAYTAANWAYYWGTGPYPYHNGSFNNGAPQTWMTSPVITPDLAPAYNVQTAQVPPSQQR